MDEIRQRRGIREEKREDEHEHEDEHEDVEASGTTSLFLPGLAIVLGLPLAAWLVLELFIPCPIDPEGFVLAERPAFEGPLSPNNKLMSVEKLMTGKFRGPESMTIHDGKMYTGVADGRVIEIDLKTQEVRTLVETLGTPPCGKIVNEKNCGRPLGIRYSNGNLFVVDAYLGLFKIDARTGHTQNLFPASYKFPDGMEARFLNDVEVSRDGLIYITDSSTRWHRSHHCYVGFENRPEGRLIVYNPRTNDTKILLRGLYFANGLQLTPDEDAILITEMARSRVTKYQLSGPNSGTSEIFADNLPGLPDNIRPSSSGGYWVALAVVRHPDLWSTWDFLGPRPWIKRIVARVLDRNAISRMVPAYGLVVELDPRGNIIGSLHDQTGNTIPAVSEVQDSNGVLYFGSYYLPFLGRINREMASSM